LRAHACAALKRFVSHDIIGPLVIEKAKENISILFFNTEKPLEFDTKSDSEVKNLVLAKMELYLSLCVAGPNLFIPNLFAMVQHFPAQVFSVLEQACVTLFSSVPSNELLPLINDFPFGSQDLVLVLIRVLLNNQEILSDVVARALKAFTERDLDVRFFQLIITYLDKV
jgi:hypothetical protein